MRGENEVDIFLGGTKRNIKFTTRSLFFLEKQTGRPAVDILRSVQDAPYTAYVLLVRAGMQHEKNVPTEDHVCAWLDLLARKDLPEHDGEETMRSLSDKLAGAFIAGLPGIPRVVVPATTEAPAEDPTNPAP